MAIVETKVSSFTESAPIGFAWQMRNVKTQKQKPAGIRIKLEAMYNKTIAFLETN